MMRAAALVLACSACTVGLPLVSSGVVLTYNSSVDHREDKAGYLEPIIVSAVVGFVIDMYILSAAGKGLGSLGHN